MTSDPEKDKAGKPAPGAEAPGGSAEKPKDDEAKAREAAEAGKAGVEHDTRRLTVETGSTIDRTKFAKDEGLVSIEVLNAVTLPKGLPTDQSAFAEKIRSVSKEPEWDLPVMSALTKDRRINSGNWDFTREIGLKKIIVDISNAEIINSKTKDFYDGVIAIIAFGVGNDNPYQDDPDTAKLFENPVANLSKIRALPKNGKFDPIAFHDAMQHMIKAQAAIDTANRMAKHGLDAQRGADKEPISDKVGAFVSDNIREIKKAVREKDVGKLAMYAAGFYLIYKAWGQMTEGERGAQIKKWAVYGGALYAGHLLLKNAGYDIPEMAGLTDKDSMLKGTSMDSLSRLVDGHPTLSKYEKDIDYSVVLQISDVPVWALNDLYDNATGSQFINPRKIPGASRIFDEDVLAVWPFDRTLMHRASQDPDGHNGVKFNSRHRAFDELGTQLYKIAHAMDAVYDNTLRNKGAYEGQSMEQAFGSETRNIKPEKDSRRLVKVSDFLLEAGQHAERTPTRLELRSKDEIEKTMLGYFDEMEIKPKFHLNDSTSHHFTGHLNGYPVVVVQNGKDELRLYLRHEYGNEKVAGSSFESFTPSNGRTAAEASVRKVNDRMKELLGLLTGKAGHSYSDLKYDNGWKVKVDVGAAENIGVKATSTTAVIEVLHDGAGLQVTTKNGTRFNLDENVAKQYPYAIALIPQVMAQEEFKLFRVFHHARRIKFEDSDPSDSSFVLKVGKRNLELKVKWSKDPAPGKYEIDAASDTEKEKVEKELLKDPGFAMEYVNALRENKDTPLVDLQEKLRREIDGSPENFFPYMWEVLTGDRYDKRLSGWNFDAFSGSVPDYFANTILSVSTEGALNRVRRAITGATSFKDAQAKQSAIMYDYQADLEAVIQVLRDQSADIKDWDRDQFMNEVIYPLRKAGGVSETYNATRSDFEMSVYQLNTVGINNSDYSEASHERAGRLMNVFAYYTSHLDGMTYSYEKNTGGTTGSTEEFTVDLDNLDWPAKAKFPGVVKTEEDPGLRGHYVIKYMDFVKGEIISRAKSGKLETVPDPNDRSFWDIEEFEEWLELSPSYAPLDSVDTQPAFVHDPDVAHAAGKSTELEFEIAKAFDDSKKHLEREYGTYLKPGAIDDYLKRSYDPANPTQTPGLLMPFPKDPSKAATSYKDMDSQLWDFGNSLSKEKRSVQKVQIRSLVNEHLVRYVFENHSQFFKQKITLKASTIKKYPWIQDIKYWPDVLNPFAN